MFGALTERTWRVVYNYYNGRRQAPRGKPAHSQLRNVASSCLVQARFEAPPVDVFSVYAVRELPVTRMHMQEAETRVREGRA